MEKLEEKSAIIAEAAQKDRPSAAGQKGVLFVRFVQCTAGFMIYTYSEHLLCYTVHPRLSEPRLSERQKFSLKNFFCKPVLEKPIEIFVVCSNCCPL